MPGSDSNSDLEGGRDTVAVLRAQLDVARAAGEDEVVCKDLEENLLLWDAIKNGGAVAAAPPPSAVAAAAVAEGGGRWFSRWRRNEAEVSDQQRPAWFQKWAKSATVAKNSSSSEVHGRHRVEVVEERGEALEDDDSDDEQAAKAPVNIQSLLRESAAPSSSSASSTVDTDGRTALYLERTLNRAIRTFNCNTKRGIQFITGAQSGFMVGGEKRSRKKELARGIASFLFTTRGLNKEKVGEYLGGHGSLEISTLHVFAALCLEDAMETDPSTTPPSFVLSLRCFLARFRLPGEAQVISERASRSIIIRLVVTFTPFLCFESSGRKSTEF